MRKITLLFFLTALCVSFSCKIMEQKNCFSSENFTKVKEYIKHRILQSSAGTNFYLEYPIDVNAVYDGIKRPSNHPENVYNIRFDTNLQEIVFESKEWEFNFHATEGLVYKKNQTKKEHDLAHAIFCHLLEAAEKR